MNLSVCTIFRSRKGFTIIEVIVVVALMVVMSVIALPSFLQWRQTVEYRDTARAIASLLRNAQSRTIAENVQHRVEIDTAVFPLRRYRMTRGNLSANSTAWPDIIQDWITIPTSVTLLRQNLNVNAGNESINYNSDGTVALAGNPARIRVLDNTNITRFTIDVTPMGRVSVRSGP